MTDGVIIQCRLLSSRLSCKAMLNVAGESVLARVIQRAKLSELPVYVATSVSDHDDVIVMEALKNNVDGVFRGQLNNVRERFVQAANQFKLQRIARITADNPFTEPSFIQMGFDQLNDGATYARCNPNFCPEGTNVEVFMLKDLSLSLSLDLKNRDLYDIEHVTPRIRERAIQTGGFVEFDPLFKSCKKIADYSLTIDTPNDFLKISHLCNLIGINTLDFSSSKLIEVVAKAIVKNKEHKSILKGHTHNKALTFR